MFKFSNLNLNKEINILSDVKVSEKVKILDEKTVLVTTSFEPKNVNRNVIWYTLTYVFLTLAIIGFALYGESIFGNNLFERSGSLVVIVSILFYGLDYEKFRRKWLASFNKTLDKVGAPDEQRKTLLAEATENVDRGIKNLKSIEYVIAILGTLIWGFGGLISEDLIKLFGFQ